MTQSDKPLHPTQEPVEVRVLKDDELEIVSGGSLTSQVSQIIKNFGQAQQTAARS